MPSASGRGRIESIEPANDTLEPTTPVTEHVPEDEYDPRRTVASSGRISASPATCSPFLPDLRPIPIHDFENMIVPGVAYGVDAQQRLHLVCLGGDVTKLSVAEHLISSRANRSMLNAALDQKGLGRLAPFSDNGLQRHALLPEADASKAGLLHRGKYNVHLLIEPVRVRHASGEPRLSRVTRRTPAHDRETNATRPT